MLSNPTYLADNEIITRSMSGIREHLYRIGWIEGEILLDIKKSFVCAPLDGKNIFIAFVAYQWIWHYVVASYLEQGAFIKVQDDFRLLTDEEVLSLRKRGMII